MAIIEGKREDVVNGAALASLLAAGIGAFAVGFIVILNEAGLFAVPALYAPAGGVSGRTTLSAVIWLVGWVVLHNRWKNRQLESRKVYLLSVILIGLGVVFTFPPVWKLL
ncbi:MAG: hypothetical protein ABIZ91_10640 [Gemmatimonadaceae bacterium]